jgi:hypothetical protein
MPSVGSQSHAPEHRPSRQGVPSALRSTISSIVKFVPLTFKRCTAAMRCTPRHVHNPSRIPTELKKVARGRRDLVSAWQMHTGSVQSEDPGTVQLRASHTQSSLSRLALPTTELGKRMPSGTGRPYSSMFVHCTGPVEGGPQLPLARRPPTDQPPITLMS